MRVPLASTGQRRRHLVASLAVLLSAASLHAQETPTRDASIPDDASLEASGAVVGSIVLDKRNIFNLENPDEDKWLYRWANRLHVVTRDRVIKKQLLFESGDPYSSQVLDETARVLRSNRYIYDARITPVKHEDGVVDVIVTTKDVWSLTPDISFSRNGGENRTAAGIEETNLLGRGQLVRVKWIDDVDRTSTLFDFEDRNLGSSWVSLFLRLAQSSDGDTQYLSLVRPFYKLDARWSAGGRGLSDDRRTALYSLGEEVAEYQQRREYATAFGGWSRGLQGGWVHRWTAGFVYDDNVFSQVADPTLPAVIPENRKLVYPYLGINILEDDFSTSVNANQIGRTEDFYMGTQLSATVGWSDEAFGADRDALVMTIGGNTSFGSLEKTALLLSAFAEGRRESGVTANAKLIASARFYHRQSEKRLFFMTLDGTLGENLDLDDPVTLGGDSGLRGYPIRYQSGDSKLVFSIEQRYYTDWYPFRLFRVGGAIFADTGRTWGVNPVGEENFGWLTDVGFGLRLAPTRFSTDKVAHLDFAFPLGGDPSIDTMQIILEAKRSF